VIYLLCCLYKAFDVLAGLIGCSGPKVVGLVAARDINNPDTAFAIRPSNGALVGDRRTGSLLAINRDLAYGLIVHYGAVNTRGMCRRKSQISE
jgi:hypothetical protein